MAAARAELHPWVVANTSAAVNAHRQDLRSVRPLRRLGRRLTLAGFAIFAATLAANLAISFATGSKRVQSGEVMALNIFAVLAVIGLVVYGNALMRRAGARIKPAAFDRLVAPLALRQEDAADDRAREPFRRLGWIADRKSRAGDDAFAGEHDGFRFRLLDAIYAVSKNSVSRRLVVAIEIAAAAPGLAIVTQRDAQRFDAGLDNATRRALGDLEEKASGEAAFDEKFVVFAAPSTTVARALPRAARRGIAMLEAKYPGQRLAVALNERRLLARLDLGGDAFDLHATADEESYIADFLAGLSFPYWCIDLVAKPLAADGAQ
jgi:hypothetical protein